jgi:hypothetical protein
MHRRSRLLAMLSLAFVLALPMSASAIEILDLDLTAGSIVGFPNPFDIAFVDLSGPRVTISALMQLMWGFQACGGMPLRCLPGTVLQVGGGAVTLLAGVATLDGVTHGISANSVSDDMLRRLQVDGVATLPEFSETRTAVLTGTFVLTGQLVRCAGSFCQSEFQPYDLHGHGVFTIPLEWDDAFGGEWRSTGSEFDVVPEPATLLLFGTSAAGLGLARLTRRRMNALRRGEGLSRASKS